LYWETDAGFTPQGQRRKKMALLMCKGKKICHGPGRRNGQDRKNLDRKCWVKLNWRKKEDTRRAAPCRKTYRVEGGEAPFSRYVARGERAHPSLPMKERNFRGNLLASRLHAERGGKKTKTHF